MVRRLGTGFLTVVTIVALPGVGRAQHQVPVEVMGLHPLATGEYSFSYRFMRTSMADNLNGNALVPTADVLKSFMVSPLTRTTNVHSIGAMYAPSDIVTLMAIGSFSKLSMDHVTRTNTTFTTESSGIGDLSISSLVSLYRGASVRALLHAGVWLPTGSITAAGVTPTSRGEERQLPYPMQPGSGSLDVSPGLTVLGAGPAWGWGVQTTGRFPVGDNDRGYRRGDMLNGTAWFAWHPRARVSLSARILGQRWGAYQGFDPAFTNKALVPTVREDLRSGKRLTIPLGLALDFPDGPLAGHRLAAEWSVPVWHDLAGPQLRTDWSLTVGWRKSFH